MQVFRTDSPGRIRFAVPSLKRILDSRAWSRIGFAALAIACGGCSLLNSDEPPPPSCNSGASLQGGETTCSNPGSGAGRGGSAGAPESGQGGEPSSTASGGEGGGIISEPVVPPCGNGVLEEGEQCDDGNVVNFDGCSADCGITGNPDSCSDEPLVTLKDGGVSIIGNTVNAENHSGGVTCAASSSVGDHSYAFLPMRDGTVIFKVASQDGFAVAFGVRKNCDTKYPEHDCAFGGPAAVGRTVAVEQGEPVHVIVTGKNWDDTGVYILEVDYADDGAS